MSLSSLLEVVLSSIDLASLVCSFSASSVVVVGSSFADGVNIDQILLYLLQGSWELSHVHIQVINTSMV